MNSIATHSETSPDSQQGSGDGEPVTHTIRRGEDSPAPTRGTSRRDGARPWVWTIATALVLVIGGANNTYPLPRGLAEAICALLLGATIASRHSSLESFSFSNMRANMRASDWLVLAILLAVLIQFIPLPPALWTALPGREVIAELDRAVLGAPSWRPITLDIEMTWRSALFLIAPLTFYVAIRSGDDARLRAILLGVVGALAIGAGMAFLQTAGQSWAFPFADGRADNSFAIGFFTNHNHQATFVLMALMALACWMTMGSDRQDGRPKSRSKLGNAPPSFDSLGLRDIVLGAIGIVIALVVLLTASRAGLLLLAIGLPAAACAWVAPQLATSRRLFLPALSLIGLGAAAFLALPFLGDGILSAIGDRAALADDRRFDIWPQAVATAQALMPTGSGFGTFRPAYEMFEPLDMVGMLYVNHAHNDYIQLAIEGGILAIALVIAFIWLWLRIAWSAWLGAASLAGSRRSARTAMLARLGSVMILMVMLHSLVDYPARTITVATLTAIAFALLARHAAATGALAATGNPTRLATK